MPLQCGRRVLLPVLDIEHRDLEDLVVHGEKILDVHEPGVVLFGLIPEGIVGSLDVCRGLAAQHDTDLMRETTDVADEVDDEVTVHDVGAELLVAARHECAVLGDEDEIVTVCTELAPQRGVLSATGGRERDTRIAEATQQGPQRRGHRTFAVEQGSIHVDRDQADLAPPTGESVKIGRSGRGSVGEVIGHSSILPEARTWTDASPRDKIEA